jgi:hypothetical protein
MLNNIGRIIPLHSYFYKAPLEMMKCLKFPKLTLKSKTISVYKILVTIVIKNWIASNSCREVSNAMSCSQFGHELIIQIVIK